MVAAAAWHAAGKGIIGVGGEVAGICQGASRKHTAHACVPVSVCFFVFFVFFARVCVFRQEHEGSRQGGEQPH